MRKAGSSGLWSKDYIFLLLTVFFAAFTHSAFTVVFPVYVKDLGGTDTLSGWMLTGLTVGSVIARLIAGPLIDRFGRKIMFVIGGVAFAAITLCYCFVTDLRGLFVLRILNGVIQGIYFSVPAVLISDIVPQEKLVNALGFFGTSSALAFSFAPLMCLEVYEEFGTAVLFALTTVFAVIAAVCALLIRERYRRPEVKPREKKAYSFNGFVKALGGPVLILSVIICVLSLGISSASNFLARFGEVRAIAGIGIFFTIHSIAGMIIRLVTGTLEKKLGRTPLILGSILTVAIAMSILAVSHSLLTVIAAAVLFGTGNAIAVQLLQATLLENCSPERRGLCSGFYATFTDLGNGLGGPIWGTISTTLGYTVAFLLSGVTVAASAVLHLVAMVPWLKRHSAK